MGDPVIAGVGDHVRVRLPYSEVCMHMRVAGQAMTVVILEHGAQILKEDGSSFSFPISHGEAGIYPLDGGSFRVYQVAGE
ncbi:hypothetical protein [Streptomyces sp. URMC 129]|uniref:hypothetical protein n=1 Tax=Streptomyces sp. URMC 129 TaxID=3423407 RepID=UPI003F1AF018